ncbi:caspase family protein [uncultured Endozoicomonas sp.]|uniref:caspase family protein n=1 Tax=uncultured Endozoicomonas sp. TaxID=432652 RepID=UPI00261ED598|nr:caspase family protein [uncultured Endozoicomonas sp.]
MTVPLKRYIQQLIFISLLCSALLTHHPAVAYSTSNFSSQNSTPCYDNQCPFDDDYYFEFENMHHIMGLFTGQNYDHTPEVPTLNGCRNDAWNFFQWAAMTKGIPAHSLNVKTDLREPMGKEKLLSEIRSLAEKTHASPGPHRVIISFSGHGTHTTDRNSDESDNIDELLVAGKEVIADDELHDAFKKFHKSTRLLVFVDTCHSGTMFDLPYRYVYNALNPNIIEESETRGGKDIPAYMVVVSASRDSETSADAYLPTPDDERHWSSQGDFSNRMLKVMTDIFYDKLYVKNIPALLRDQKLVNNVKYNLDQHAVLTSNFKLDKNLKLFGW